MSTPGDSRPEPQLRSLIDEWNEALRARDVTGRTAHYADEPGHVLTPSKKQCRVLFIHASHLTGLGNNDRDARCCRWTERCSRQITAAGPSREIRRSFAGVWEKVRGQRPHVPFVLLAK